MLNINFEKLYKMVYYGIILLICFPKNLCYNLCSFNIL